MRLGPGRDRRAAGAGRRGRSICPARPTCRPSKASIPKKPDVKLVRHPEPRRAVLRPGVQDSGRPARRLALRAGLLRHAEGQQPRLQSRQGQEGKRAAVVAHPGRPPRARSIRSRPATSSASSACATRSPATRFAAPQEPILLESIAFPETVISMAIEPETSTERKKLADVLEMMKRQDPTFRARENEETGQTLISGMGELHLEVIKHRLLRDFRLNVRVHKPRVSYRETIEHAGKSPASATATSPGRCSRPRSASAWSRSARARSRWCVAGRRPAASLPEQFLAPRGRSAHRAGRRRRLVGLPADARQDHGPRRRGPRNRLDRTGLPLRRRRRLREGACARRASCCWSRSCGSK